MKKLVSLHGIGAGATITIRHAGVTGGEIITGTTITTVGAGVLVTGAMVTTILLGTDLYITATILTITTTDQNT